MAARRKGMMYVKTVTAKGRTYCYFDTGQRDGRGKRIYAPLPSPNDRTFGAAYAAMLGHRTRRDNVETMLTVQKMVDLYHASDDFRKKAPATQKIYQIYQGEFASKLPTAPAGMIERRDIVLMLDQRAATPAAANMILASVSALYKWARKRGHVSNRPTDDIDPNDIGEHEPWPDDLLRLALTTEEAKDQRVRLSVHLLYYTAQRIGDVVRMRWADIKDGEISIRQQKTGKEMVIPVHPSLARELDRHQRDLAPVLKARHGRGIASATLRDNLQAWARANGHSVVPHGLRKNAVNALLEAGCTVAQTSAISGQSIQMIEHYSKLRSQAKLARSAMRIWHENS